MKFVSKLLIVLILITVSIVSARSAEAKMETALTPYFWLSGIDGDVTIKGISSSVEAGFSDIVENIDFALMFHLEMRKGDIAFYFDPSFINSSQDAKAGPINAELETKMQIIEFGALYTLHKKPIGKSDGRFLTFDMYGGFRYTFLQVDLDVSTEVVDVAADVSRDDDWFDPLIGLSMGVDVSKTVKFIFRGDIGGFGFINASDFAWKILTGFKVDLSQRALLFAGYQVLDIDYDKGIGTNETFVYDMKTSGPVLGLGIWF